jgi:hypothetical protein
MGRGWSSRRGRVLAGAQIGVLTWVVTPDLVDEAVGSGARERRLRSLPSRLGVYFVLGLCLFSHLPYGQVLRELASGLEAGLAGTGWQVPAPAALTAVRRRVGDKPLESLFTMLAGHVSHGRCEWSHLCGLLAVAWDGTTVSVPDTAENTAAFGKTGIAGKNRTAGSGAVASFPAIRLVTLVACGTRALLGAAIGPVAGKGTGEQQLAASLTGSLRRGMLLLADRGFYSWTLWHQAAGTGADLLWRVKSSMRLPVLEVLPDGSWLSRIADPAAVNARAAKNGKRRRRGSPLPPDTGPLPGKTVRVIAFTLTITTDAGTTRTQTYRLITTLTDWRRCPAPDLAAGYARRWAIETSYQEFKTYLRGPGRVLRSRTPDLARQELWAYLTVCQALRVLIARAAARDGLDPGRISFTATLHAARRTLPAARTSMHAALDNLETEILAQPVTPRPCRISLRAVRSPRSPYTPRRAHHGPIPHHATTTTTITTATNPAPTTPTQHKHPKTPAPNPP